MYKEDITFLLLALLLFSCNSQGDHITNEKLAIDIHKRIDNYDFSNFFELISVVPLETNTKSFVSNSKKVKIDFYKDKIILANDPGLIEFERLMVFNLHDGTYLNDIGKSGEGPSDFWGLRDFAISKERERVILLVAGKMSLMEYTLDGQLKKSTRIEIFGDEIELINSNFLIYNELNASDLTGNNFLIELNERGDVTRKVLPYDLTRNGLGVSFSGFLDKSYSGDLLFNPPFSDTIFQVKSDGDIFPYIIFDLGKNKVEHSLAKSQGALLGGGLFGKTFLCNRNLELESGFLIEFIENDRNKIGYYNYNNQKFYVTDGNSIYLINRLFNRSDLFTHLDDGNFVLLISAEEWIYLREKFKDQMDTIQIKFPLIAERILTSKENDNPTLLIFKSKL